MGSDDPPPAAAAAKVRSLVDAWRSSAIAGGEQWPEREAEGLVAAVLSAADGGEVPASGGEVPADGGEVPADGGEVPADGGEEAPAGGGPAGDLETAARRWAGAHTSTVAMIHRLAALDDLAAELGDGASQAGHLALKEITEMAVRSHVEELESAAMTDHLTGVGNRRAMREALDAATASGHRHGHEISVVMVDLDGLKAINDQQGHAAGDHALVRLASALRSVVREEDQVFRIGGDEFVILLTHTSAASVHSVMRRAASAGSPAFSWGIATSGGESGDLLEAGMLLAGADIDLYERRSRRPERRQAVAATPSGFAAAFGALRSPRIAWGAAALAVVALGLVAGLGGLRSPGVPAAARPISRASSGSRPSTSAAPSPAPSRSAARASGVPCCTVPAASTGEGGGAGAPPGSGAGLLTAASTGGEGGAPSTGAPTGRQPGSPAPPPPIVALTWPPSNGHAPPGSTTVSLPGASITVPPLGTLAAVFCPAAAMPGGSSGC